MIDQLDLDRLRNLIEAENVIAAPIETRHARAIERYLLFERAADRLNDVPFDLILQAVWIDDQSAVVCDTDASDAHTMRRFVDLDVDRGGDVRLCSLVLDEAEPATLR